MVENRLLNRESEAVRCFRQLICFCSKNFGQSPAFTYHKNGKEQIVKSFLDFERDIDLLGAYLHSKGLTGKRVAIVGENSYQWITLYFALACFGSVAVALDRQTPPEELSKLINTSSCSAVFFGSSCEDAVRQAAGGRECVCLCEVDNFIESAKRLGLTKPPYCLEAKRPASIVFTSGTTGSSKGVLLSQENLVTDACACACMVEDYKRCLLVLPIHHTFGLVASVLTPLAKGCNCYISASIRRISKDIAAFKPEAIIIVPVMAQAIYNKVIAAVRQQGREKTFRRAVIIGRLLRKLKIDVRRRLFRQVLDGLGGELRGIICGGAAIDPEYVRGFTDIGIDFLNGYGITECSPVVCVNSFYDNRIGSAGRALRCCEVRVSRPDESMTGEIQVRGQNVMLGYLDDEQATEAAFEDGWFKTGDLGRMDKKGHVFITGRLKNTIILSNGKNVSPEELEEKLLRYDCVCEVVVYEQNGKLAAQIYPNPSLDRESAQRLTDEAVNDFNKRVETYKNIELVSLRDTEFEKTTTMKIKRKTMAH